MTGTALCHLQLHLQGSMLANSKERADRWEEQEQKLPLLSAYPVPSTWPSAFLSFPVEAICFPLSALPRLQEQPHSHTVEASLCGL